MDGGLELGITETAYCSVWSWSLLLVICRIGALAESIKNPSQLLIKDYGGDASPAFKVR